MRLKLQVATRDRASAAGLFVALELATVLLGLGLLLVGEISGDQAPQQQEEAAAFDALERHHRDQAQERKCVPHLNIVLPQARANASSSAAPSGGGGVGDQAGADQQEGTAALNANGPPASEAKLAGGLPASFTFPIGDIHMPLAQTGSPIQSAMRLLSTFDSQLSGLDDGELEGESNGADEQHSEADGRRPAAARENSIRFVQNKLHISDLNLTMLNFHLYAQSQPRFGLGLNIGNATLTGQFFYDGATPSLMGADFVARLAGHYRMSIDNVLVTASSNLTKQREQEAARGLESGAPAPPYRLRTNELRMNISNLGYISIDILDARDSSKETPSYLLKMLQRVLQKTIKRTYNKFEGLIRATLETEGRRYLDCELTRFSPILRENQADPLDLIKMDSDEEAKGAEKGAPNGSPRAPNNLDDLARIVSSEIRSSRLDRVRLPNLEHQRVVLGTNALIVFTNGSLAGLDNLRLLGETKVKLQNEHLIVNASLGWFNLRSHYNWTLYVGQSATAAAAAAALAQPLHEPPTSANLSAIKPTARGFVGANIKAIEFDTLISRSLRQSRARVSVDELKISRLDGPKMELGGLPGMNRLARGTVNFLMGRLKLRLVGSIQPALRLELERALNRLAI